jgi:diguanylate cyclase (GGDEF)-like protein
MEFAASILPFIAASICLVFSLHFLIVTFIVREDRSFLVFFFLLLVLAVNQLAVGMQVHNFPENIDVSFFWYRVQFAALAMLIFMTIYFFNVLASRKINTPVIYVFFIVSAALAVSTFSPIFGTFMVTQEGNFIFLPHIGAFIILLLMATAILFLVFMLIDPLIGGRWTAKSPLPVFYVIGGIILLGLGSLEIMTELGVIAPTSIKYSSFGAVILALVGASVVLVHFYQVRASLRNILINLTETERELEKKERLAITDGLTGLYNRAFFDESIDEEVKDSIKNNKSLSLIMLDIDGFKRVNDTLGHLIGDSVLAEISGIIKRGARGSDLPARFGGEEFAVILPNTTIHEAHEVGERIRHKINEINFMVEGKPNISVTVSVGVATLKGTDMAKDLLDRADKALITAKRRGKNTVCVIK